MTTQQLLCHEASFYVFEEVSDMNGAVRGTRDTGAETPPPL